METKDQKLKKFHPLL